MTRRNGSIRRPSLNHRSADVKEHGRLSAVILDGMCQFVALLNPKGDILEVNRAALDGGGHKIEEIRGMPFWTARWWQVSEQIKQDLQAAIRRAATGEFVRYEVDIFGDQSGRLPITIDFSLQPIRGESGEAEYLLAEGRNITERKRAEEEVARQAQELRVLNERLKELDRLKTQFFANVSHEFRMPLTLMRGPREDSLANTHGILPAPTAQDLRVSHRNALRLLKIVNTMLDFSPIEAGRLQASFAPVDLAALTGELASNFRSACEKAGLQLVVECPPLEGSEPVYVDRDMWEKIVLNLVSNAFNFTLKGKIEVRLATADGQACLTVQDTGVGIPTEELPRMFERFHCIEHSRGRMYEGTGIGLALVHELVKLHGGAIRVESVLGEGSAFTVTVPLGRAHLDPERIGKASELASTAIISSAFVEEYLRWLPETKAEQEPEEAEAELRESEQRFRHIADNAPVMIWTSDPDASCTFLSKSWYEFTGQSAETGLGFGWGDAVHPDDWETVMRAFLSANERREAFRLDYRLRRKDGEYRWAIDSAAPRFGSQGEFLGYIGSVFDITERKLAEETLKKADRRKDEFLAMVSHELRSPLNSILGWNRMLRDKKGADPYIARVTEVIERSGQAQLQLIEDLLDTARIVSGKMRLEVGPVELSQVLTSAIETIRPAAESKGVVIIPMLDPEAGRITGDPERLQQVFWNLLSNAVKFTPAQGRIHIELRRGPSDTRIVVRDTGEGISPDLLPYVFDRLNQGDSSASRRLGGLGLGLAIVKNLVELHGGRVSVESPGEGMGATFTVSLPTRVAPSEDSDAAARRTSTAERPLDGLRILVVDDEEDTRELVAVTLSLRGARVTQVESAATALAALESRGDEKPFDVIVSDIGMSEEDGYSLMRRVRDMADESVNRVLAVALTARARFEDRMRALHAGFQTHVAKPVEIKELITVVEGLTRRKRRARTEKEIKSWVAHG